LDEVTLVCSSLLSDYWNDDDVVFELAGFEYKVVAILTQLVDLAERHQQDFHRKKELSRSTPSYYSESRGSLRQSAPASGAASAAAEPPKATEALVVPVTLPAGLKCALHAVLSLIYLKLSP